MPGPLITRILSLPPERACDYKGYWIGFLALTLIFGENSGDFTGFHTRVRARGAPPVQTKKKCSDDRENPRKDRGRFSLCRVTRRPPHLNLFFFWVQTRERLTLGHFASENRLILARAAAIAS